MFWYAWIYITCLQFIMLRYISLLITLINTECNITCHAKCTHLVPDFCGMTMKRASEMIDQIQRAAALRNKPSNDSYTPIPNEQPLPILPNQPLPPSPKQAQF